MNIFVVDKDPVVAAQSLCDKHVVKMILESGQMLSTAHRMLSENPPDILYKCTHKNHPCSIWTRLTNGNYLWHYAHFKALADEYFYRYGRNHLTYEKLGDILSKVPSLLPSGPLTQFATATNIEVKDIEDPILQYQAYYRFKSNIITMKWSGRNVPDWMKG